MAVTDSEGKVVETYNYTPYGELIDGTYSDNIAFLYNGQYGVTTDDNGLYYMRARYYNVDIKRFVNQDVLIGTLERISSLNRYAYVEGKVVHVFKEQYMFDRRAKEKIFSRLECMETVEVLVINEFKKYQILAHSILGGDVMMLFPEMAPITVYIFAE